MSFSSRSVGSLLLMVVLAGSSAACGVSVMRGGRHFVDGGTRATASAADDFHCPTASTESRRMADGRFEARGCEQRAYYTCNNDAEKLVYIDETWTVRCDRVGDIERTDHSIASR